MSNFELIPLKIIFSVARSSVLSEKLVKEHHHRIQGSKNQAVKSGVKENRVKCFQNFLLYAFSSLTCKQRRDSPMPGKIFIDAITAAFWSPYASAGAEHLAHETFSIAVSCNSLCPQSSNNPSRISLNFHSLKTFPHLPTYIALVLGHWVAAGPGRAEA